MFDPLVIDKLSAADQEIVKHALAGLASTAIFDIQQAELLNRLGNGALSEEEPAMLERLRDFRRQTHALVALRELGKRYIKDSTEEE